jgi:hypothetical protein
MAKFLQWHQLPLLPLLAHEWCGLALRLFLLLLGLFARALCHSSPPSPALLQALLNRDCGQCGFASSAGTTATKQGLAFPAQLLCLRPECRNGTVQAEHCWGTEVGERAHKMTAPFPYANCPLPLPLLRLPLRLLLGGCQEPAYI